MTSDPNEVITQSAKALQEMAKTGSKAIDASRHLGGWLDRIFGQAIEDTVAVHWSDRIRAQRIERAIYDWEKLAELMGKVEIRLQAKGIDSLRANLLTTGCDAAADQIHKKYVSVLADLTHEDAIVFKTLCEQWLDPKKKPEESRYGSLTYGPSIDGIGPHSAISIITLNRLGLISPGYIDITNYSPNEERDFKDPDPFRASEVRAYGNLDVVEISDFGIAFYRAVISD